MSRGAVLACLVLLACDGPRLDVAGQPIIGGTLALGDPAVVGLSICPQGGGCATCTGSLVAPRVVLTAAHCLDAPGLEPADISVFFGGNMVTGDGVDVAVDQVLSHRYFDPATLDSDLAMLHLAAAAPAGVEPIVLNDGALEASDQGRAIRMVGFGITSIRAADAGIKRQVDSVLGGVAAKHLFTGSEDANTCKGDSGGPTFLVIDGSERQIGVTSRSSACAPDSVKIRVDRFLDDLIWPFVDHFEGPCQMDGTCEPDCPRSPDPDCDPCLRDGVCASACQAPDWDCPLGLPLGAACSDAEACEGKRCQAALDDPRVRYCSRPCDPALPDMCLTEMTCVEVDGEERCVWPEPSPGALGASCGLGEQCRSGLCEDAICVERCGEEPDGSCPSPFECRPSTLTEADVCGLPASDDGGCGCGTGGGGPGAGLLLLLLAVARGVLAGGGRPGVRRRRS